MRQWQTRMMEHARLNDKDATMCALATSTPWQWSSTRRASTWLQDAWIPLRTTMQGMRLSVFSQHASTKCRVVCSILQSTSMRMQRATTDRACKTRPHPRPRRHSHPCPLHHLQCRLVPVHRLLRRHRQTNHFPVHRHLCYHRHTNLLHLPLHHQPHLPVFRRLRFPHHLKRLPDLQLLEGW